jgi:hypothetical protein
MTSYRLLAVGLLLATSQAPLPASAQTSNSPALPSQCRLIENRTDGVLVGECQVSDGLRASALRPAECRTSISLRNGVLSCTGTTTLEGPLRVTSTEGRLGDLLATVLGTQRATGIDTSWSDTLRPAGDYRTAPERRIAEAVAARTLTSANAASLRRDHQALITLDTRHAADGRYTLDEHAELEDRYAALNTRIDSLLTAAPALVADTGWEPLANRRADFDDRLLSALDARVITLAEANRLRTDWAALVQLESDYGRNGLDAREVTDLETRLNGLETRLGRFGKPLTPATVSVKGAEDWARLEARIAAGERDGSLNRAQLERLRTEQEDLRRLDDAWRRLNRNRLTSEQQAYLDRRHAELSARIDQMEQRRR